MTDVVVNFLHLLATALWIGGALVMHVAFQPALGGLEPHHRGMVMGVLSKRFSIVAWASILILVVTGLLKTPEGMLFDTSTEVGTTLLMKHLLVIAAIIIGLVITLGVVPSLQKLAPKPGEQPSAGFLSAQRRIQGLSKLNTVVGLLILFFASMLW